ncbi:MAG: 1-acyl-sn-glycerol-3-phosphate acyltransferase [Bacteroidales bacterium]
METIGKVIDLGKAMRSGKSKIFSRMPGFLIRLLEKLVHQDDMNYTIHRSRHLDGIPFINDVLDGWKVDVIIKGSENLPPEGRFIFVANHPVGAIDALSFFSATGKYYKDIVSPSNELLNYIPNLRSLMLGINVFGKNSRETAQKLNELFDSNTQVLIFPAGEVSRRRKGVISDPLWQKTFVTKAIQSRRDIVPVHISGRNSELFYRVANLRTFLGIKMYLETILLPGEMMSQRGRPVTVTFGKPVSYTTLTPDKTHQEWALEIRKIVYSMIGDKQ